MSAQLDELSDRLAALNPSADDCTWPTELLAVLRDGGCLSPRIAESPQVSQARPPEKLLMYEAVSAGSLTAALIVTQHHAAAELLAGGGGSALADRVLAQIESDNLLLTVGISQLTTSRSGKGPALRASATDGGFRLDGRMPWVTSAAHADWIVSGAVTDDDRQILACISPKKDGVVVEQPMRFMALSASSTSRVRCEGALVSTSDVIRGPSAHALQRRAPVKPLSVSFVGLGLAKALWHGIREQLNYDYEPQHVPLKRIEREYNGLRNELYDAAVSVGSDADDSDPKAMRARVNGLLHRLAATHLTLAKGTGYVAVHSAQQRLREASFFLVWSAPPAVQSATILELWNAESGA